jgi:hypothetical protein
MNPHTRLVAPCGVIRRGSCEALPPAVFLAGHDDLCIRISSGAC